MLEQGMLSFALLGATWVLWLLVALSVLCVAVAIERGWYFLRAATDARGLAGAIDHYLAHGDLEDFSGKLGALDGAEARVLRAGADAAPLGSRAAEKAMSSSALAERMRLERGLAFLATVGSNAPFIGLFGTVLGIIQAFHDLALDSSDAQAAVMAGISEALVATAAGLLVAIPAVILYNGFQRAMRARLQRAQSLSDLVLARLAHAEATSG